MNEVLLHNYNTRVKPEDTVYFLGDMSFGRGSRSPRWWLSQLNGQIYYIKGSHDNGIRVASVGLNAIKILDSMTLPVLEQEVLLIHDPAKAPLETRWVVHGHVHNYKPAISTGRINISADVVGFRPVTIDYIAGIVFSQIKENKYA